ncbi:MAG: PSD1 domain-containing protein [Planctomycetes bacterium]|nr:PSD1 domain-containing protein [Planctomycetota bacterium]
MSLLLALPFGGEATPQSILVERCVACHGPDQHKGDLRLDQASSATRAIAPGKPQESELFRRLISADPEERMPKGKPALPPEEIEVLRAWIAAGAKWPEGQGHWAYQPLAQVAIPAVRDPDWVRNPIDAFVLERLDAAGLAPQRVADSGMLLRRLSLDLVGLPPTLEELHTFEADRSPGAYERAVERLLASPHFGERWALPWLDLARFADTNGYEKDARRSNWAWRDWVIDALNADMPFDRFTLEQLAGDLLPGASTSQHVATGFQRNTLVNQEGGTDPEEFRYAAVVDRTNTAATVWLGSTLACAQCHNHKYDPFSQRDYYRLLAFFDQSADTGNAVEPVLSVPSREQQQRQHELAQRAQDLEGLLANGDALFDAEQLAWELRTRAEFAQSTGASAAARRLPAFDAVEGWEIAGPFPGEIPAQIEWRPETGRERGVVRAITQMQTSWLWQRNFHVDQPQRVALLLGADDELRVSLDESVVYEGTQWDPVMKDAHRVVLELGVGDHRLELRVHNGGGPGGLYLDCARDDVLPDAIEAALLAPAPDAHVIGPYFRREVSARGRALARELGRVRQDELALAASIPTTMVMQEASSARTTHVHVKGAFLNLGESVSAQTPACLPPMDPAWPKNRLGLGLWLADPRNPLVARVQVNRIWEQIFGRGLVATSEDFGTRGAEPTHRELLDWLALEYLRNGWSLKQLLRTIVGSASYQQSSLADARRLELDPDAALLSHSPRGRLSGELLRDNALSIAGLLDAQLGGPSVFPPQPEGVWTPVYSDDKWMESGGGDRLRRGLYTFWKRSSPYANFMLFDAPSREGCCPRRARTDTPLQALALLNDPVFVECARALGEWIRHAPGDRDAQLSAGFERCTAREPAPSELAELRKLLDSQPEPMRYTAVGNVLLNLDETLCRP